jgi:hypothetical protein
VLTVVAGGKTWKFHSADGGHMIVIGAQNLSCAWTNQKVAINYRETADGTRASFPSRSGNCAAPSTRARRSLSHAMKRYLAFIVIILGSALLAIYVADYLIVRYKVARKHDPFGSVTVRRYYSIEKKANKTEYVFAGAHRMNSA